MSKTTLFIVGVFFGGLYFGLTLFTPEWFAATVVGFLLGLWVLAVVGLAIMIAREKNWGIEKEKESPYIDGEFEVRE